MDLHETFRETSYWCPKIIKTKKDKPINKQTNKPKKMILNIFAKSSLIFMKLPGKVPVGVPR